MAAEQEGNSQSKQHSLNSRQFMTGLSKMMDSMKGEEGGKDDNPPFTNDAVEALRLCHEEFLHFVACELGHRNQNSKDDTTATITVEDIMDCLEGIGFAELKKDVLADLGRCGWTENEPKKRSGLLTRKEKLAKKKARRQQVDDNYEEQERLLASSATAMSNTSGYTKVVYSVDDNTVKEKSAVVGADEKKSAAL